MSARAGRIAVLVAASCAAGVPFAAGAQALVPYRIQGGEIRASLTGAAGDAVRGREVVRGREEVNCLICHAVPGTGDRFMGDVGPSLAGVAARLSAGQLRLWLVDARRVVADTIMPSYYAIDGLQMVAARYRGKPILDAQQIEDAVAYLSTLKEGAR